jgi:hypothetical protein
MSVEHVFRDQRRKPALEPLCAAVLEHQRPTKHALCCIFDDAERSEFLKEHDPNYCGFFCPIAKCGIERWPEDLKPHVSALEHGILSFTCELAVYVRKRTCEHTTATTITFAHEIQHLMQHDFHFKFWRANFWLPKVTGSDLVNPKAWDLPSEYDAQLAAKRISQSVLGIPEVERYAKEQIEAENDPEKWEFFLELDVSREYDFVCETRRMVDRFKGKLDALYREYERDDCEPDFTKEIWWE